MKYGATCVIVAAFIIILLQTPISNDLKSGIGDPNGLNLDIELFAEELAAPVGMQNAGDNSGRLFILQQNGSILICKDGEILTTPFLDISKKLDPMSSYYSEKGLLGLAFHPNYSQNGKFFIYYSAPEKGHDHKSVVAEFRVDPENPNQALSDSRVVIEILQPESNHNGGDLAFGIDGYLYISTGDGGGADDRHGKNGNGQDLHSLLGKILRIDVDAAVPYAIPRYNPFNGNNGRAEIWAYGLRNPWRISFDRLTGKLFTGDVGQNKYEEIDIIEKGKNYGWRVMEGYHCFNPSSDCDRTGLTLPIYEYPHSVGISVTGGYVYRGKNIPELYGKYIYGDWNGKIFALTKSNDGTWNNSGIHFNSIGGNDLRTYVNSFGEDEDGELYILTQKTTGPEYKKGIIYKITAAD